MPDFNEGTATLGTGGDQRIVQWRLATVIVRSNDGWGSGAFISPDGWLLTNYHVVASAAQKAAVTGGPVILDVIAARMVEGRIKPQPALKSTVYQVDPVHDLALLKLQALPAGIAQMPYFKLAREIQDGENCFVIGSQGNGPAWWVRSGNVSQQFDFPEDLSQFAAGMATSRAAVDRDHVTVIVTDTSISPGDSGGPLLNSNGELIGLTFATPANTSGGSVGWHIALPHLRAFVANLPGQPEGVPFDAWTAGLPEAVMLEPGVLDGDHDGRADSLLYRYASPAPANGDQSPRPIALTAFVDLNGRSPHGDEALDRLPFGLWGMETQGHFRFDVFVTARADHVLAVGYPGGKGIVDEIRVGTSQDGAKAVWRREADQKWHVSAPSSGTPLLDPAHFNSNQTTRLSVIMGQVFGTAEHQPESGNAAPSGQRDDRTGPNSR